ncbi:MAG: hypothetical protein LBH16_04330 [Treponema sp.]|jgi:hypothetical protein|nr:hypothetical protein [Treponema sp.]
MKIKLYIILIFLFICSTETVCAQNLDFKWNIGNIKAYYNPLDNNIGTDLEILYFNWLLNYRFGFGFNAIGIHFIYDSQEMRYAILPVELSFLPLNYKDFLFFSIYGRLSWLLNQNTENNQITNGFFSAIGIQLYIFHELRSNYSLYFSLFAEYNNLNQLRLGTGLDLSGMIFEFFNSWRTGKEREYNERYR